jgi:hypothetical protein
MEEITKQFMDEKAVAQYTPQKDITVQNLDAHIDFNSDDDFILISSKSFFVRLWFLISNPFFYLFAGYIRY